MSKLLNIGQSGQNEDLAYYKSYVEQLKNKTIGTKYAQRRAFENAAQMDEMFMERELQSALEDISSKEDDFTQLFDCVQFLFDRNDEF